MNNREIQQGKRKVLKEGVRKDLREVLKKLGLKVGQRVWKEAIWRND